MMTQADSSALACDLSGSYEAPGQGFGGGAVARLQAAVDDGFAQVFLDGLDPGTWRQGEELHQVVAIERAFQFG